MLDPFECRCQRLELSVPDRSVMVASAWKQALRVEAPNADVARVIGNRLGRLPVRSIGMRVAPWGAIVSHPRARRCFTVPRGGAYAFSGGAGAGVVSVAPA